MCVTPGSVEADLSRHQQLVRPRELAFRRKAARRDLDYVRLTNLNLDGGQKREKEFHLLANACLEESDGLGFPNITLRTTASNTVGRTFM